MKKLLAVAVMAAMLCLAGLVMSGEAHAQRFVDNGNGTVTDTVTGLMWTKNANPFGGMSTWQDAMSRCSSFSISGIGGWRLPSSDELVALSHAIQGGHPFNGVQMFYWSSTTHEVSNFYALDVFMDRGWVNTSPRIYPYWAWPVRNVQ